MNTSLKALLAACLLLLAGTGTASALDACFQDQFGNVLVGQSFKLPRAGKCSPFNGYFMETDYAAFGNACGTSNGKAWIVNLLASSATSLNVVYTFFISAAMNAGAGCDFGIAGGSAGGCSPITVKPITCPTPHPFG